MKIIVKMMLAVGIFASLQLSSAQINGNTNHQPLKVACSDFGSACRTLNELISAHDTVIESASMACLYAEFPKEWFGHSSHDAFFVISSTIVNHREEDGSVILKKFFEVENIREGLPEGFPYRFPQKLNGDSGFSSTVDETNDQLDFIHDDYSAGKQMNRMELSIRKSTGRFRQTFDAIHELHGTCFNFSPHQR